mgnify:CR=1 FL=1
MLQILPFLAWLAVATSVVLLVSLWKLGNVRTRTGIVFSAWLVAAAYCQFVASSATVGAIGLVLQTILAIYLILRWRLNA